MGCGPCDPPLRASPAASVARFTVRALSEEYGFTDVDGTHPDYAVLDAAVDEGKEDLSSSFDRGVPIRDRGLEVDAEGGSVSVAPEDRRE